MPDERLLKRLAAMWMHKLDWPFEVIDGAFRQLPSAIAGAEPDAASVAYVFAVMPTKVLAFAKGEHYSQSRYLF